MDDLRKLLEQKRLILGTKRTLLYLKKGKLEKVYLSSNCPEDVLSTLDSYTKIGKFKLEKLESTNDELGVVCRKPFAISIIGLLSNGNE